MQPTLLPNMICFEGDLDETVIIDDIVKAFDDFLENNSESTHISVDFSKVLYANSSGIIFWIKFLDKKNYSIKYVNCPLWLVNQFNMIMGFLNNNSFVESLQIPFFSETNNKSLSVLYYLKKDIPLLKSYSDFNLENKEIEGISFEPDIVEKQYFDFISKNIDTFQKYL